MGLLVGLREITVCYGKIQGTVVLFLLQGLFPPGQGATIGVDFMIKTVEINGEKVKVRCY